MVWRCLTLSVVILAGQVAHGADAVGMRPQLARDVLPLLLAHCVKCHGLAKREGKLNLTSAAALALGGETGAAVVPGQPEASLLWQRVEADEMPPDEPLAAREKAILKDWIAGGAADLPAAADPSAGEHWSFKHLAGAPLPAVRDPNRARNAVDHFLLAQLEALNLSFSAEADRTTLIRRVSFDLTGLPPTPAEIEAFVGDTSSDAYERLVERYLASPHYGQRWGKFWLDAAGYADSNGYFNADTDRPLAYRYRDYVIRALNEDKPLDRFVLEQLAGDELSGFVPERDATPEMISLVEATHFLRNGPDGTGESDGNPDEVRIDRYSALESTSQIVASSLLGLTVQCAKCHDHKFEPISQREYYQLQSVFYPAFDVRNWLKPNERVVYANLPGELRRWEEHSRRIDAQIAALRREFADLVRANRAPSTVLFHDEFDDGGPSLADNWSNTAPGDDTSAGEPPAQLDSDQAPAAQRRRGALRILESGAAGDRWLSTKQPFDWTPEREGEWVQVTFDLVDDRIDHLGVHAARVGYYIALHDFNHNRSTRGGNILFDGNPAGGAAVHLDYPGANSKSVGTLGESKYQPGHNYGVRITNIGDGKHRVEHLVDFVPDEKAIDLVAADLPDGGFGFEYCCGRSFIVDNVLIERNVESASAGETAKKVADELRGKRSQLASAVKVKQSQRGEKPGRIACVSDRSATAPDVFLLLRGNYATPGEKVEPAPLATLGDSSDPLVVKSPATQSTGRRLAWARWLIKPDSRAAALLARVQVNRIWQHHFGAGIVATAENLGVSGAPPSHPELLDYLAGAFIRSGWSVKAMHRLLMSSAAYRQQSVLEPKAFELDPDDRLLWRYPLRRLDAEALRDAMIEVGGQLDRQFEGPYVPTTRNEQGEVLVKADLPGALRRSLYLQQRRTQTLSLLGIFDSPSMVFNCIQRPASTMPLQSLSLLNSEFVVARAGGFARRLEREAGHEAEARIAHAYLVAFARRPSEQETSDALQFTTSQREHYADRDDATFQAWRDFCQMLLASNTFLYVD